MSKKQSNTGADIFKFNLGDDVRDSITGFEGVVVCRTQWIHNCNAYGLQPRKMKDGKPGERHHFDEPSLELIKAETEKPERNTGGPERKVFQTNR